MSKKLVGRRKSAFISVDENACFVFLLFFFSFFLFSFPFSFLLSFQLRFLLDNFLHQRDFIKLPNFFFHIFV